MRILNELFHIILQLVFKICVTWAAMTLSALTLAGTCMLAEFDLYNFGTVYNWVSVVLAWVLALSA